MNGIRLDTTLPYWEVEGPTTFTELFRALLGWLPDDAVLYFEGGSPDTQLWVEVWFENRWVHLEGFILDRPYLESVQNRFSTVEGAFCGYAIATHDLKNPPVEWAGSDTYIQKDGINHDYGVFDSPDDFYQKHGANLRGVKRWLFKHVVRKWMNNNISRIRRGDW